MKSDETLLNASGVPTADDLKAYFRKNDFTAGIAVNDVQRTEEGLYKEVRRSFSSSWDKSLKHLGVKESGPNYSSSSPLAVLKRADSGIIASSVLDIMRSEELTDEYFDSFFKIVEKPLSEKLEAYAAGVGKAVDDLSDEEFQKG